MALLQDTDVNRGFCLVSELKAGRHWPAADLVYKTKRFMAILS